MSEITEAIDLALAEAKKHEQDGDLQAAHDIYSRVLVQDPRQRKAKKALRALERKMGSKQPLAEWELQTLLELYERNELARALPMAQRLERNHPDQPMIHNVLGAIRLRQNQAKSAKRSFEKALAIDPGFLDAENNLAHACITLGEWEEAQTILESLLQKEPSDPAELHFLLGLCLQALGDLEKAVNVYLISTQQRPLFPQAHINLGGSLWALGRTDEARTSFENALEVVPDDPGANESMANLLIDLGLSEEAAPYLKKAGKN